MWACAIVDALGRCWFLLLATLSVGFLLVFVPQGREALWAAGAADHSWHVWAFFATSLTGAVLVSLFASQILEAGDPLAGTTSHQRGYACFAVPGMLGLLAAFLVPLLIEHLVAGNAYLLQQRRRELRELGVLFQALVMPAIVLARCPKVLLSLVRPWRLGRRERLGVVGLLALFVLGLGLSSYPFVAGTLGLFGGLAVLDGLWSAHSGYNNFHTEPAFARALRAYVPETGIIPPSVETQYTKILIMCKIGNGYGVSRQAEPIYDELLGRFSDNHFKAILGLIGGDRELQSRLQFSPCRANLCRLADEISSRTANGIVRRALRLVAESEPDAIGNIWLTGEFKRAMSALKALAS